MGKYLIALQRYDLEEWTVCDTIWGSYEEVKSHIDKIYDSYSVGTIFRILEIRTEFKIRATTTCSLEEV